MMKLKVKETYFDKKEDKYIYPEKTPTIEREEKRAKQLIDAGVVEELEPEIESEVNGNKAPEGKAELEGQDTKPAKGKGKK
ncbi:MAG: hypothetical protein ACI4TK_16355 [Agathobacter sp.]